MLYVARCIKCNHLLKSTDAKLLKEYMESHSRKSHKIGFDLLVRHTAIHSVKNSEGRNHAKSYHDTFRYLRLSDFEDFHIMRIRHPADIRAINRDWKSPHFWHTFRNLSRLAMAVQ